jgi:hypothetical protein
MSDIIDINVEQTVEDVTINVVDNVIQVNINNVSGGGGAVDSVNGQTGVVVLDQDDIADGVLLISNIHLLKKINLLELLKVQK